VRGPRHVIKRGKTPVLTTDQARVLIESIDTSTLVGLRDRAVIGAMTYAFARIGAVVSMRVEDYFANGKRWWVRLHEKGGKRHEMPAHHKLEAFLDEYIRAAGIAGDEKSPLFRSAVRRTGTLAATAMHRVDAWRMIQRRSTRPKNRCGQGRRSPLQNKRNGGPLCRPPTQTLPLIGRTSARPAGSSLARLHYFDVGLEGMGTTGYDREWVRQGPRRRFLQRIRPLLAHCRDGGRPSWRPVVEVVLPPLWHQGHRGQPMRRTAAGNYPRTAAEGPRRSGGCTPA
jgi:hypothetical protein